MKKGKYVILEIIPTTRNPETGDIAQLSALKLDGLILIDRFDYRLDKTKIDNEFVLKMIDYDNDKFNYEKSTKSILKKFQKFSEGLDLLIIDSDYTKNYLNDLENNKESVFNYLGLKFHDDVIEEVIKKYNLEPSNYIVDLLYEALIYEDGKKS